MKTSVLNQIIRDSQVNLDQELLTLEQAPELFIDSVCEKSYDEMSQEEREDAQADIREYLIENF